jgi:uncharacterized protein (DUF885 family)
MNDTHPTEKAFVALSARFLTDYLARDPVRATEVGEHRGDGRWPDVSEQGEADFRRFTQATLDELGKLPKAELSPQSRVDHAILQMQLRSWLFALDELRDAEQSPLYYSGLIGDGIDPLVTRSFAPREERMGNLRSRLEGIPGIIEIAKKRLKNPARVRTETAIEQAGGLIDLCEKQLAPHFAKVPAQKAALEAAASRATAALKDWKTFLEKDLLPRSQGEFRLGRPLLEKKLAFYLGEPVDIDAIAKSARDLLAKTQDEMFETTRELWPTLFPKTAMPPASSAAEKKALVRKALDELAKDRPDNTTIVKESERILAEATQFVRDHNLVRVPDEPCRVIEMPEYRRGVAVAYCDAAGPLEKNPETFFAISPAPADWSAKRVESFYREYNRSMLADLVVHEAMPGHFLQIMHNNRFPSKLRAVFASGPFVEGWAVYTEWLMAKHGFGGPKVRLVRQKMVVRTSANAILDHDVHAGTMDEAAALALMTQEGFQEEGEAVGKWRRARLTSAQLTTYFFGFTEMMKLRARHEKEAGFSEGVYHDRLLSFGSPPMQQLRELMSAP